ncbi:type IX secretion system protein PorG [Rudanella paleaurantiibacter]|nr:DUF6089 family protein [Rudanella paleaurantiibacter]
MPACLNSKHTARLTTVGLFMGLLLMALATHAQQVELGGGLGGMLYKGDLAPSLNPRFYRPAGNLFFRYNFTRSFSMRAGIAMGGIKAEDRVSSDPFQQARNRSFRTRIGETTVDMEYFFRDFKMLRRVKNWSPYVFGGIGYMSYSPRNEGGPRVMYPLGVGLKYEIKRPWSIGFEFGTRFTRNDDLDGLGKAAGAPRLASGNPALNDSYTYTAITLSYTFYKITCPE